MPVLPASGYNTPVAPTVEPAPTALTPYQEVRAPAEAFGAASAQALSGLGTSFDKAAGHLENIQTFYDQVVVDEQKNSYDDYLNKKMYGDPNVPGDKGYMGTQGKNALEQRESVRRDIDARLAEQRSTLKNARQLHLFNNETSRYRNYALSAIGRHYDEQYNRHAATVAKDRLELDAHKGAVAANNNDFGMFKSSLESALVANEQALRAIGADDVTITSQRNKVVQAFTATWASNALERNAPEGRQFILDHKEELGDKYDEFLHKADRASLQYDVDKMLKGEKPGASQPNLVRGGAVENALDEIAQRESGNKNIHQELVSPSISSAQGYFQITNPTWKDFASADIQAKYPTAMAAPYEVQRQVAREILTSPRGGPQRWEALNKSGRTGPIREAIAKERTGSSTSPSGDVPGTPAPTMPALPPNDPSDFPDAEVPGLLERLQKGAKLLPPNAKPELWDTFVRQARQEQNMAYNAEMQKERQRAVAQQKADREIGDQYYERIVPGSTNMPSEAEILKDTRISQEKRKDIIGVMHGLNKKDPDPATANNNMVEAYKGIGLPDGAEGRIYRKDQVDRLYGDKKITWEMRKELQNVLDNKNNAKRQWTQPHITQLLKDAERVLFPLKHLQGGMGLQADPGGSTRERAYQMFVERTVEEYIAEGKDVRRLVDPGLPDKPNPEYLGSQGILDKFAVGARGYGPGQMIAKIPTPGELKDNPSIMQAYKEGRFGVFGSPEALELAKQYSIGAGLSVRKPPGGAPVR